MKMTYNECVNAVMRECVNQTDTLSNSQDTPITNMQKNKNEKIATRLFYIGVVMVIIVIDLLAILYAK